MKKVVLFAIFCMFISTISFAGKPKMVFSKGDIMALKPIKKATAIFSYENLVVGANPKKSKSEDSWLKEEVAHREKDEKGSGEEWKKNWFLHRTDIYEPEFYSQYIEEGEKCSLQLVKEETDYVFDVKVKMMDEGTFMGATAWVTFEVFVYKKGDKGNNIAVFTMSNIPGQNKFSGMVPTERVKASYELFAELMIKNFTKAFKE